MKLERRGILKFKSLNGWNGIIIVEKAEKVCGIVKRVMVPKSEVSNFTEHTIIREGKNYYYVQQVLTIQNELVGSIYQFLYLLK